MTQVEVTVPAYALVNNPIPVSINLPKGGARIRMQVIYEEEVIYESVYNILKSIKIVFRIFFKPLYRLKTGT